MIVQEAILRLIEAAGAWNAFDGPRIVRDLRASTDLWRTAVFVGPTAHVFQDATTRAVIRADYDYSAHRELPAALLGYDTLQLTPQLGREEALETLANSWSPDEAKWIGLPGARSAVPDDNPESYRSAGGDPERVLLELWWD